MDSKLIKDGQVLVWVSNRSSVTVISAREATALLGAPHSNVTSHNGVWFGHVPTRRLPESFSNVPVGERRFDLVREERLKNNQEALLLIHEAFPNLKGHGEEVNGDLELPVDFFKTHEI